MSTEYRVRIVIEERRVSRPGPHNYLNRIQRSRWVKTAIDKISHFSDDFDEQLGVYTDTVLAIDAFNAAKTKEALKGLKI